MRRIREHLINSIGEITTDGVCIRFSRGTEQIEHILKETLLIGLHKIVRIAQQWPHIREANYLVVAQSARLDASAVLIWCGRPGRFLERCWSSDHSQKKVGLYITKGISSGSNKPGEGEGHVYKMQNPSVRNTGYISQQTTTDIKKITMQCQHHRGSGRLLPGNHS